MKQRIAWITDSTAYVPDELRERHDIHIVPLDVIFEDGTYEDGFGLSPEQLYEKIDRAQTVPTTSQPSVGKFLKLYETLAESYDCAIAVHLSSRLSGTYNASLNAAGMVDFPIEVVDSQIVSYPITALILKGIALAERGEDFRAIAAALREEAAKNENYIVIGSLSQLHKGGRLSSAQFFLGNLLQIKPIFRIRGGVVELFEKVRTESKAVKRILEQLEAARKKHRITEVQILHGNVLEKALELKESITARYQDIHVLIGPLSSVLGVHGGRGTLALTWTNEPREQE
ncbi:DegV family protein [Brevibacillus thermoruber]|uniref:DegV family protein n=1 Tax=Brevibacillus thermoruber TaxID=33942 RepID=UPI000557AB6C|nr:DegV family protein [Brevibacillus thermoruber]